MAEPFQKDLFNINQMACKRIRYCRLKPHVSSILPRATPTGEDARRVETRVSATIRTLTAEAVADKVRRPLYVLSAGGLR